MLCPTRDSAQLLSVQGDEEEEEGEERLSKDCKEKGGGEREKVRKGK